MVLTQLKQAGKERGEAADLEELKQSLKWLDECQLIHPAQDFVESKGKLTAFASQLFKRGETTEVFVITSNRELIPCSEAENFGYPLKNMPTGYGGYNWPRARMKAWLDGGASQATFYETFLKIKSQVQYYFDMPEEEAVVDALFAMQTYYSQLLATSPILFLNATKRAGKTKLLKFLSYIVFNGAHWVEPSDASYFRVRHHDKATILMDEVERIHEESKSGLRVLLNASYQKGVTVPRVETVGKEKRRVVVNFDLYGSTAIANINGVDDVLEDRCITQILKRSVNKAVINREPRPSEPVFLDVRADLYELMLTPSYSAGYLRVDFFSRALEGNVDPDEIRELDLEALEALKVFAQFRAAQVESEHYKPLPVQHAVSTLSTLSTKNGGGSGITIASTLPLSSTLPTFTENVTVESVDKNGSVDTNPIPLPPREGKSEVKTEITSTLPSSEVVGRAYSLWKPLMVLAACTNVAVLKTVIAFAEKHTLQRKAEEATENQDVLIAAELVKAFVEDGWFKGKPFIERLHEAELDWVKPQTLGKIMKRLGLVGKRFVHGKTEYLLRKAWLEQLAVRLGLDFEALRREGAEEREDAALLLEDKHLASLPHWQGHGKAETQEALK